MHLIDPSGLWIPAVACAAAPILVRVLRPLAEARARSRQPRR